MYQVLIELSDINTMSALYFSLYVGVILKLVWAWNVEYSFMGSITQPAGAKINHPFIFYREKCGYHIHIILIRIIKYIRRKKYSQDDTEEPISFYVF